MTYRRDHWSDRLVRGIPADPRTLRTVETEIAVRVPEDAHPGAILVATRIAGLIEAMSIGYDPDGRDRLLDEDLADLLYLLTHASRVARVITGFVDRVTLAARARGASLQQLATQLEDVDTVEGVRRRLASIARAEARGRTRGREAEREDLALRELEDQLVAARDRGDRAGVLAVADRLAAAGLPALAEVLRAEWAQAGDPASSAPAGQGGDECPECRGQGGCTDGCCSCPTCGLYAGQ